jgi:CRP-like cAMP-binding protein
MGFFRGTRRSATVSSDGPVVYFTLTRTNFERLRRERPDLAIAFADFIARVLADRIDFTNQEVPALTRCAIEKCPRESEALPSASPYLDKATEGADHRVELYAGELYEQPVE